MGSVRVDVARSRDVGQVVHRPFQPAGAPLASAGLGDAAPVGKPARDGRRADKEEGCNGVTARLQTYVTTDRGWLYLRLSYWPMSTSRTKF